MNISKSIKRTYTTEEPISMSSKFSRIDSDDSKQWFNNVMDYEIVILVECFLVMFGRYCNNTETNIVPFAQHYQEKLISFRNWFEQSNIREKKTMLLATFRTLYEV